MGRFNQVLVALVVTVFPMTILALRDPPKLHRDRNAQDSLQTASTLHFERWTGASGIFNPPFTVSNKDLTIGKGAILLGKAGVMSSLEGGKTYFGFVASDHRQALREYAATRQLPHIIQQLNRNEKES